MTTDHIPKYFKFFNSSEEIALSGADIVYKYSEERLSRCKDVQCILLNTHILAEYLLNQYCKLHMPKPAHFKEDWRFSLKLQLSKCLGLPETTAHFIKLLNNARNSVAHQLEPKMRLLDLIIQETAPSFENETGKPMSDYYLDDTYLSKFYISCQYIVGRILKANAEKVTNKN